MDYRSVPRANNAGRTPAARKISHQRALSNDTENAPGFLNFDSDRSTTLDSLKDLMAFSQRPTRARQDDILTAAKNARAQMPPQFREPPSSTGSHGTVTTDSINLDRRDDITADSASSSTFSAPPDAESTRASVHYQRGSHRVQRTTGRFGKNAREDKKTTTDMLSGIVNTSALFRTFSEWKPEDVTDPSIFEDDPSTTNFGIVNKLSQHDQENCGPIPSSPVAATPKPRNAHTDLPARRNRNVLQPTVQNESELSAGMTTPAQKPPTKPAPQPSPLRKASTAVPAPILKKPATVGSMRGAEDSKRQQRVSVVEDSPLMDDLTSPETSAGSREDIDLGVRTVAAPVFKSASPPRTTTMARSDNIDGATNQSFIVPSKSFPLLHNLVTGTLKFTPGTYFYGNAAAAQRKYQLPAGTIPEEEKEIFVDIDNIREEVIRLQEHDEMLQNEIVQGEIKYKSLLDRFYDLAHKSDSAVASDFDEPLKESQEENELLYNKIQELELDLDAIHTQYEEQMQASKDAAAERDAALARASSATEKANKLSADLGATRERLAASAQRPSQEAQRRIQQLEKMVSERERVIKAVKDEREAATSSHREECRLYRERITRLEAEKMMLSSDHAKCGDERYALNTAKEALALKNTALKQKVQAVREQGKKREATTYTIVERQRTQITKLQTLLREKERSVHLLDENFRKLRESWPSKDETLMRMNDILGQWPGGRSQEHRDALNAEPTEDFDVDTRDFQFDEDKENAGYEAKDILRANQDMQQNEDDLDGSDAASDSGESAEDHSVDENMTSAFIIPDIDIHADEEDEEKDDDDEAAAAANERALAQELAQADRIAARNSAAATKSTKTTQQKSVSFQTTKPPAATSVCKHNRVNCVICYQKAGHVSENEKVTVAVPRPISAQDGAELKRQAKDMDPGSALAYVMKLLDDERRHLWMQIQAMRKTGETEEALNEKRRPRRALREAEELWNSYVLKVEQLNRLDDVLEGQRAAGQDMTREEIDVTITRILEA